MEECCIHPQFISARIAMTKTSLCPTQVLTYGINSAGEAGQGSVSFVETPKPVKSLSGKAVHQVRLIQRSYSYSTHLHTGYND